MGKRAIDLYQVTSAGEDVLRAIARLQLSAESTDRSVILLCTLAEGHTAFLLRTLIDIGEADRARLDVALLRKVRDDMFKSWPAMFDWFRDGFELYLRGVKEVDDLLTCVDLRNAIVHGNSSLTGMQMKSLSDAVATRKSIENLLDIAFTGNRAIFTSRTRMRAIEVIRTYILHVNHKVLEKYPAVLYVQASN